jgi:autotransporter-associated beta strand protein
MIPTSRPAHSHRSHAANTANTTRNTRTSSKRLMKRSRTLLVAFVVVGVLVSVFVWRQVYAANILWSSAAGSAWLTGTNWTGNAVPTGTDVAQFGVNPTAATGVGINFNGTTNAGTQVNGQRIEEVGAVEITNARAAAMIIGNSSGTAGATGKFRPNGAVVNGVSDVIIRNNSNQLLTIQNTQAGGNQTMSLLLGDATNNIVTIDGTGSITISSIIQNDAGNKLTLGGAGAGTLTLSGVNTYSGDTTISSGKLSLGATGSMNNSPNIIVGGGGTFDVSTRGGFTLASGQGLRGTGTATTGTIATAASNGLTTATNSPLQFTAFNGTTAPLTISGAGTVTLASGNPVTVNTTTALGAGDFVLIAKGATGAVAGTAPTSLTVGGSGLASGMTASLQITGSQLVLHVAVVTTGKYRSRQNGNWNDFNTWQTDTGSGFVNAVSGQTPTSAADTIQIQNTHTVTVSASVSADQLTVDSGGAIQVNPGQTLTIADGTGTDLTNNGTVAVAGAIANSGQVLINNLLRLNGNPGGSVTGNALTYGASSTLDYSASGASQTTTNIEFPAVSGPTNLTINNSSGVSLHAGRTITGTLDLVNGIFTTNGNLFMANGSQITKSAGDMTGTPQGAGTYNVIYTGFAKMSGSELDGAGLTNVTVDMNPSQFVSLTGTKTVPGTLALTNGMVITGSFTLIANGAVTRNTGMVVGNLQRRFAAAGPLTFDVGTVSNSYSPVVVNATAGSFPASFIVSATGTSMPGVSGANKLNRYWTLNNLFSGITSANLTFTYPSGDVTGTVANYQFIRKEPSGVLTVLAPTGTPTATTATINGVTQFSDWTLAETNAIQYGSLQFSAATYSDNETNGDHTFNAVVTRTGGSDGLVAVNFAVTDGTALVSGNDYSAIPDTGFLQWSAGDAASQNITITVKGDTFYEGDETVNFTLSGPLGGATLGSPSAAVLTILNDDNPPATLTVTNSGDAGGACISDCTLRQAINTANFNPDTTNIFFNIPGAGLRTIAPASPLPLITAPVFLDGYSQPLSSANTLGVGDNANLLIELDGTNAGASTIGLEFSATAGSSTVRGLVINRFGADGIRLSLADNCLVTGNFIGTNGAGTAAAGNGLHGVHINGANNTQVGGSVPAERNIISGGTTASSQGIQVAGTPVTGNVIKGNYIGTNAAGTAPLANGGDGVRIVSSSNTVIGGAGGQEPNIIAGNLLDGIRVGGDGTIIRRNYIGTNQAGDPLGNGQAGIHIIGGNNSVVGGTPLNEQNTIANNGNDGVFVQSGTGNAIRGNSIHDNTGLGIDLGADGVTANDNQDPDSGANNLQNFPTVSTAFAGTSAVLGTLNSTPGAVFTIDVYANTACDGSGNGEGQTWLGSVVTSAADGNGDVSWGVSTPLINGTQIITATATDASGNTSEFSACRAVIQAESSVVVSGGNLVITDELGNDTNDALTISLNGANVRIQDPINGVIAGSGATQIDANTAEVPLASITGNIQVSTLGGNDTLTLALAGGDFIPAGGLSYAGGAQTSAPGDKLVITGGSQGAVTYNYANANDGNVVMSAFGTVTYTGLEPITNSGSAADVVFNLPAGTSSVATLSDLGGGSSRLASGGTFEQTDFANPTGSVTITGGSLNDFIGVNALAANYPSLTINGGQGTDVVAFNGNITFAVNKNLDVNLQNDDPTPGIDDVSVNGALITSGTGTVDVRASEDVIINSAGRLQTQNGNLTVEANQQATSTATEHDGVVVDGGTIESTGSGNVVVKGRGGEGAFDVMYGVIVWNGGKVLATGTGTVTVEGTGGARTGGAPPIDPAVTEVFGVYVYLLGSEISSASGAIQITGQGGATNYTSSYGVVVAGGKIQTSGAGTLIIDGTGGTVTGGSGTFVDSGGVFVVADDINADGGVVASAGTGVNAGNIIITGTSGLASTGSGQGLRVDAPGSVTAVDGSITLAGTGGACGNACLGTSIRGQVEATGTGAINITGTGAASTGAFPTHGVNVRSGGAVTTTSGNITITGTGGNGTDNAGFNVGSSGPGVVQTTDGGTITVNADAIRLATNANATIDAGAADVSLRQKTNTVAIDLGSTIDTTANTVELSDGELDRIFTGTLHLGNASSGAITVSAAISRAAATVLSLVSGANIDIAAGSLNSNGGNVTLNPNTNVFPSHTGVDVTTGAAATLSLTSGKDLKIDIDGTMVDTGYTQLNVAGLVDLNSANLSFAGSSYLPVGGESFTIVNNDGADAITGAFANGPTFTNFLGSPYTATISYTAGDGNDAVLTVAAACTPPAIVYVDDSWVGTAPGTDPDGGAGPATNFGCDSFATIQGGVNGVATSGTVNVANGLYTENVTIPKSLTLTGAGAAGVTLRPAISDPNCGGVGGGSLCAGSSNLILVQANDVTISGLTLDGDNTTLPGGINVGGANVDARNGIITNHLMGTFNNLEVHHTTVQNIFLRGIYASSGGSFNFHDNAVQNVQAITASIGMFNFGGTGAFTNNTVSLCNDAISSNNSRGTTFTGNTVTMSASGIHTDNAGSGGGSPDTISNNTVTNSSVNGYGIWVFVPYKTVTVENNTVTNVDVGLAVFGDSGVTTTTKPEPSKAGEGFVAGRTAPPSANVNEPGAVPAPMAFNVGVPDLDKFFKNGSRDPNAPKPNAPPVAPFSASFKGNTVDGQNKVNSTGVYFTTSQIAFGNGNPKVAFSSNTVVNNVDGFYLETANGFTLETAASFNRIVNNTNSAVTTSNLGTLNGSMENNWWGCNAGPNNLGCGNVVGSGVDFDPWIVLGISASPGTIPPGGSTTVTADMTHNSNNAVPSVTEFVPPVAVTFGATNGTVFPTSGTITNGQATTTFTSNSTSSGSALATVDNQTVSTPINVSAVNTYTWSPLLGSTNYDLPTNWTPTRFLPQTNDTLVIDGAATPSPLITDIPTQTIAGLHLINGASATLNASTIGAAKTLTLSGATLSDLTVPATNALTLAGTTGLTINVASGSAASVAGLFLFQDGPHRLVGAAANAITFQSGAISTTVPGTFSGNPFGSGVGAGNGAAASVIFANGSTYSHNSGDSPFGTVGNGAVVTFQTGSLARWFTASGFQASGRTYANLQIGAGLLVPVNVSDSGTGTFTFDDLTVRSTSSANSSLTYDGSSGSGSINIQGNISSTGAGAGALPDVTLTPGSGGTHINKVGGGTIVFSNDGLNTRAIDLEGGATVDNGTTLSLARVVLLGLSNPHLNVLTVASTADISGGPSGYVVGSLSRVSVPAGNSVFPVGTTDAYSPVDLANAGGGGSLTVAARTPQQPVLAPATSLHRYWSLTETGTLMTDLTFHYLDGDVNGTETNYRVVVVEGGNATSFPADANHSVDTVNNTFTKLGVQNFSDWTVAEPAAPTAVKLSGFSAVRSGDEVKLQWRSGYEARNLGYHVYREQDGKRVAITPSLVAGSALVAGNSTRLTAGLSYVWYDNQKSEVRGQKSEGSQQTADSKQQTASGGQRSSPTYWLEDVDLNGTRTLHGPIAIAECGMNAECRKLSERSKTLGELTNPQAAAGNQQSQGVQLSGWPAAITVPDSPSDGPDPSEMQRTIAGMDGLKISVSRPGWYRVTQPQVLAAGLNIADANGLQLYRDGRQVPFRLSNSTEQFGPTDYLEFYGEGLDSTTAAAQVYYLVKLANPGSRIEVKEKSVGPGDRVSPQGFAYTVERKERMIYFSSLLNGDAENFFGQVVTDSAVTAVIPVSRLDPPAQTAGTPAQLEVSLQGVSSQSHLVQVRFNGTNLGTINFANMEHPTQTLSVPAAALHDGNNIVELTSLGGAADVSLVDVLRLTYMRGYVADNNALSFNLDSRQTKRLTGFTNDHIRVVDISDPNAPVELTPEILPDGAGFAALIGVDKEVRAPFSRPHKLLAFADGQADTVDALDSNAPSSLWSETAGADYVMITTAGLKASIEPLAQLRRNQGMIVQVVDVEDLYDEFSFGEHSPAAIHDYLVSAMSNWTRKPHYLLLAGDATYDPKNYTGQGTNDLVPTKLIDTMLRETASDDWLADFNGDGMADISVGRLPIRTAGESTAMVAKIVGYENAAPDPSRGALLVADNSFEAPSSAVQSLLPSGMTVATINRSSADDAAIHNQIIAALNQGPLVANYIGHGSNGVWTGASLLSSDDAPTLTNTNRLSVFTMMTCFNGFFQDAYNDSLSEALLKAPGGAVAVWASTTLTEPGGQQLIDQEFYRLLFGAQPATVGDAARAAKVVTTDADVRRTWTLFGDPAMRIR